jgi:hypothetical protein
MGDLRLQLTGWYRYGLFGLPNVLEAKEKHGYKHEKGEQ